MCKKFNSRLGWLALAAVACVLIGGGCDAGGSDGNGGSSNGGIGSPAEGGGFVWKPIGENSGRLVILLPPQYTGRSPTVFVAGAEKQLLEVGVYTGVGNGGRMHFRFTQRGGAYGVNLYAVAEFADGQSVHWVIPNGVHRVEY